MKKVAFMDLISIQRSSSLTDRNNIVSEAECHTGKAIQCLVSWLKCCSVLLELAFTELLCEASFR